MPRTPLTNLRVDPERKARWEEAAAAAGMSLSEFIKDAVDAKVLGSAVAVAAELYGLDAAEIAQGARVAAGGVEGSAGQAAGRDAPGVAAIGVPGQEVGLTVAARVPNDLSKFRGSYFKNKGQ